ncbi:MAG: hypothetical protein NTW18_03925 [Candidatus Omnitrophica bacterium]|nr:hypothetical protein [Candidatus Omnitrophota bacterium]
MLNTPKTNKIEDMPKSKLTAGKIFKASIKNPNKYNTGNFTKSNSKSFCFGLLSMAISSKLRVNKKLAINQLAPTKIPAP